MAAAQYAPIAPTQQPVHPPEKERAEPSSQFLWGKITIFRTQNERFLLTLESQYYKPGRKHEDYAVFKACTIIKEVIVEHREAGRADRPLVLSSRQPDQAN
ncbi:hypothetical protein ACHAQJ_009795 [Trichoderma viride]